MDPSQRTAPIEALIPARRAGARSSFGTPDSDVGSKLGSEGGGGLGNFSERSACVVAQRSDSKSGARVVRNFVPEWALRPRMRPSFVTSVSNVRPNPSVERRFGASVRRRTSRRSRATPEGCRPAPWQRRLCATWGDWPRRRHGDPKEVRTRSHPRGHVGGPRCGWQVAASGVGLGCHAQ